MANFDYKPCAQLIKDLLQKLGLTKDTYLIHQPTKFGDWRFTAIADYLQGELNTEDVWQLSGEMFRDGHFSVISNIDISDTTKSVIKWNMPKGNSVAIFTNFSDLKTDTIELWVEIGETFREEGIRPKVITQLPSYRIIPHLCAYFDIYVLYDDKIVSVGEVGQYETTDGARVRELITAFSRADTLSDKELAFFRMQLGQFLQKEFPLYLEYLLLTHDDVDFTLGCGRLRLHDVQRGKYNRSFCKLDRSLRLATIGFFSINNIQLCTADV